MYKYGISLVMALAVASCSSTESKLSSTSTGDLGATSCDSSYPLSAALEGISGYVQLSYDIDESGRTANIGVIKSVPENVFDEVAKCSLSKWKYNPKLVNGVPVYQPGLSLQLDFNLENDS